MEVKKIIEESILAFSNIGLKLATKKYLCGVLYKQRKHELLIRVFLLFFLIDLQTEGLSFKTCTKMKVRN